jgi:uncharacterized surface protein with fasciclin (FAS1) repeats
MKTSYVIGIIVVILVVIVGAYLLMKNNNAASTATTTGANTTAPAMPDTTTTTTTTSSQGVLVGGAYMLPTLNIVQNALNASNVTTLVAAVKAAGLVDTLEGPGPFTVFAPDNDAFNKLPAGTVTTLLMPANKAELTSILTYHVVSGHYTAADLHDGQVLTTVEGQTLMINKSASGMISVNGIPVITPDVISSNGVTFVIGSVLMPPSK